MKKSYNNFDNDLADDFNIHGGHLQAKFEDWVQLFSSYLVRQLFAP